MELNSEIERIEKRDGSIVDFKPSRIENAIHRAFIARGESDGKISKKLTKKVVERLEKEYETPNVEDVQNKVVEVLKEEGYEEMGEDYQNYRKQKAEIRELKKRLGHEPEIKMSINALSVLRRRYLLKDEGGKIIETPEDMFERVAQGIAEVDKKYNSNPKKSEKRFYKIMKNLEFLPNSPTLFNTNAPLGELSACYVLPIHDSLKSIFSSLKQMILIEQGGGGVGFNFSELRPRGDIVKSTKGVASGPVSFMRVFNSATDVVKAGGKRRGAMMGILDVNHPDILEFIEAKKKRKPLSNFNLSVAVTDDFMKKFEENIEIELINPRTDEVVDKIDSEKIWSKTVESAWKTGDPGLIFIDEINRNNPTPDQSIKSTNPCGEVGLLPHESCNLGSINLSKMVEDGEVNWDKLKKITKDAVHFLDNVIDANKYPSTKIEEATKENRKIGLGVMGFADMLIKLKIPYDSQEALGLAEKTMEFIQENAREKSIELAKERGSFPNFENSIWNEKYDYMRNATVTSIAPTGTISIIGNCSSSIEPLFSVSFIRNVLEGSKLLEINPLFEKIAKERGFYSAELLDEISKEGSLQNIEEIPEDIKKIFKTSLDIDPEWHVKMQAAFQKYVDNAVSKTINLPENAPEEEVSKAFKLAWELDCKGITVYRYGSKSDQVLQISEKERSTAEPEFSGGCPKGTCKI